jgi:hypothetical protein
MNGKEIYQVPSNSCGICFADMGKEALKISIKDDPTNFKQIIDAGRAYNLDSIGIQSNSIKLGTSLQALEQKDSVILFCNEESANAWKDGADKYSDAVLKDCIGVIFRDTNEMFVFNQIAGTTRINDINMLYVQNRTNKSVKVKMESHGRTITIEEQEGAAGSGRLIGGIRGFFGI